MLVDSKSRIKFFWLRNFLLKLWISVRGFEHEHKSTETVSLPLNAFTFLFRELISSNRYHDVYTLHTLGNMKAILMVMQVPFPNLL